MSGLKTWQIITLAIATVAAIVLGLPEIQKSYMGAVLSGRCLTEEQSKTRECSLPAVPTPPPGSR